MQSEMLANLDIPNLKIVHYPHPVLKQVAEPVEKITPVIADLAEKMIELMVESQGVGLAAPQVGVSIRLVVVSLTGKAEDAHVLVNPELSNFTGWSEMEEGCLSLPDVRASVKRAACCTVKAQDLDGNEFVLEAVDFPAIVYQHETDHLDGKLFIDRLNTIALKSCKKALKRLEEDFAA